MASHESDGTGQVVWEDSAAVHEGVKADAVALVLDGDLTVAQVARDLGVGEGSLGNWVRQARIDRGDRPGLTTAERTELAQLRRENAKLRMERELLKRATAQQSVGVLVGECDLCAPAPQG